MPVEESRMPMTDLHWNRNVYWSDVPSQCRSRLGPVAPLASILGSLPTPFLLAGSAALLCGGVTVVVLVPWFHSVLGGGSRRGGSGGRLAGWSRRWAGGDGGIGCWAVLLPVFEAEGVTSSWRGGRGLGRLCHRALLQRVFGHVGERHVIQFGRCLRPAEGVHLKNGLPLLDPLVDGELSKVWSWHSGDDFRPRAAAGLRRRALRPVCHRRCRRGVQVRVTRSKGEGLMLKLLPPVADVRMWFWWAVGVQGAAGERSLVAARTAAAIRRVAAILAWLFPSFAVAALCLRGAAELGAVVPGAAAAPGVKLARLESRYLLRVSGAFE